MSPARARRTGAALIALALWLLFAAVIWACFLAPTRRSLDATLTFLITTPSLVGGICALLLAGGLAHLLASAGRARLAGASCVLLALAWLLVAARSGAFGPWAV
ncbi:MAG TPA: hypothetical protein VLA56_05005 [Pseudomonadales bacterium]|nr:hypothetical protein [Pseudomonadales bacterium]